ncbi:uracil phosphoribosyltransferase [Flexithrix dorotheae]|uniref:uracil phosphoribosyltransferase n=1 Tax=Flexithrix dorotheae TaxID=70993 RepID=UPI0003725C9A|nr:uracil phosphoribosyltransferase [Flexithrix dorotheae]
MFILTKENSIANHIIAELRDVKIQKDSYKFRKNLERLGWFLGYEISKTLQYQPHEVQTPLGTSQTSLIKDEVVLATILRAGLPFYQGFVNIFEQAESAFIGAYRQENNSDIEISVNLEYLASPNLDGKVLILIDPMLATGKSLVLAINNLLKNGKPKQIHVVTAIASEPGVKYLTENIECELWIGALDSILNAKSYIVPGLGDAGDLSFGEKL